MEYHPKAGDSRFQLPLPTNPYGIRGPGNDKKQIISRIFLVNKDADGVEV